VLNVDADAELQAPLFTLPAAGAASSAETEAAAQQRLAS
jgi:hypothetical protein